MSRDLYVNALDLEAFRKVQGSGDRALLRQIADENARMIAAHDSFFRGPAFPRSIPLMTAVMRIVDGTVDAAAAVSPQYEHAVALLADTLGEAVDENAVREAVSDFYEDVDRVILQRSATGTRPSSNWPPLGEVMCRGPLLAVPIDPEARLGTGYLTTTEVSDALDVANHVDLDDPVGLTGVRGPEDALEIAAAYRDWLRAAARRHVGLFFHY